MQWSRLFCKVVLLIVVNHLPSGCLAVQRSAWPEGWHCRLVKIQAQHFLEGGGVGRVVPFLTTADRGSDCLVGLPVESEG